MHVKRDLTFLQDLIEQANVIRIRIRQEVGILFNRF